MAFNHDGGVASNVTIGAVGADRWQVEIFGRASHAGVAPERGISSTMILAPGTPPSCSAALSSRPIAASFPVTP